MLALAALSPTAALAQEEYQSFSGPGQIGLQRSVTPLMDSIVTFHNGVLLWTITLIVLLVAALLVWVIIRYNAKRNPVPSTTTHNTLVEIIWTIGPILILIIIAIPSFGVLSDQMTMPDGQRRYLGSNIFSFGEVEVPAPAVTLKVTGQQWYWDYEYIDNNQSGVGFSSSILSEEARLAAPNPQPRLLAVDNMMVVPVNATVRLQITSDPGGVMHAFGVPALGVLMDAVPGRLNEYWFNARETGVFYGQCRELCGKDHAYMPIGVRVVEQAEFDAWYAALQADSVTAANATLPPL